jgi:hypothetical protein
LEELLWQQNEHRDVLEALGRLSRSQRETLQIAAARKLRESALIEPLTGHRRLR